MTSFKILILSIGLLTPTLSDNKPEELPRKFPDRKCINPVDTGWIYN